MAMSLRCESRDVVVCCGTVVVCLSYTTLRMSRMSPNVEESLSARPLLCLVSQRHSKTEARAKEHFSKYKYVDPIFVIGQHEIH